MQNYSLTKKEHDFLVSLSSPIKIQKYLDTIPFNFEEQGETCMSPRRVIAEKRAHCLEGALLATLALTLQERTPYILNLKVADTDVDHVVALYKENGYWGAISKTNHAVLNYRDPVYKTVRELAMSYFHEYFLVKNGKKTMIGYSRPISMKRFGVSWATEHTELWHIAEAIFDHPVIKTIPPLNKSLIRDATKVERAAANISKDTLE